MKMKVTVNGQSYQVEVEVLDPAPTPPSADSRVEGSAVLKPPPSPSRPGSSRSPSTLSTGPSPSVRPESPGSPTPPPSAWHGLGAGAEGLLVSPLAGVLGALHVKLGDSVRAGDPVASLSVSQVLSPGERPLTGTVRAPRGGTIREVLAQPGDVVAAGQPLARLA